MVMYIIERINILFGGMSDSKARIQFHPRKLSHTSSKQKFSPYRKKVRKDKNAEILQENKEKLQTNEPIIKFKELLAASKTKLRLAPEKYRIETESTVPASETQQRLLQIQNINSYNHLLAKIEQQTDFIQRHFKDIKRDLRLPKIVGHEEQEAKDPVNYDRYEQNQRVILGYLQELTRSSEEITYLKRANRSYQQELVQLKNEVQQWRSKYCQLEKEYICREQQILQQKFEQTTGNQDIEPLEDAGPQQKAPFLQTAPASTFDEAEIHLECFKELRQLTEDMDTIRLENEILREEVKLLNYSIVEKEAEIARMKRQLSNITKPVQNLQLDMSESQTLKSPIKTYKSRSHSEISNSIRRSHMSRSRDSQRREKRLTSLFVPNEFEKNVLQDPPSIQSRAIKNPIEIDQQSVTSDLKDNSQMVPNLLVPSSGRRSSMRKSNSVVDYSRFNLAKSYLKIRKKESFISKEHRQKIKKEIKEQQCFSQEKMYKLNLIRRTLGYKFKGLKCSFQEFQLDVLEKYSHEIGQFQMCKILAQYPFLLGNDLIQQLLCYVKQGQLQKRSEIISTDRFCNKIRQFIPDYEAIEEQEQMRIIEKIKKTMFVCQQSITSDMLKYEQSRGTICEEIFMRVMEQYKFSQMEIQIMISQCCIISNDADHLNFEHYLSIFEENE